MLCFLDGSVNSCRALFNDLGTFAKFSGLKPNISKTQAFWVGASAQEQENAHMCFRFNFKLPRSLKFWELCLQMMTRMSTKKISEAN